MGKYTQNYIDILKEELVLALGCTEPIALAYGAAKVKSLLKADPKTIHIKASANLIKNIQSVVIPNTKGLVGIKPAIVAGLMASDITEPLKILSKLNRSDQKRVKSLIETYNITISKLNSEHSLHFEISAKTDNHEASVEIKHIHTNIVKITVDGKEITVKDADLSMINAYEVPRDNLNIEDIYHFAKTVDLRAVKSLISDQIKYNMAIAKEGLAKDLPMNIGRTFSNPNATLDDKIKAYTSAASEARMCGSAKPVMTNSGSGNQGLSTSIPIIVFANEHKTTDESLYRALILSNLLTIHQKTHIGRLSAFCGAISACASSAAGFVYLKDGSLEQIKMALINTLADAAGVICDGAKASCAAKITTGLSAAYLGYKLAMQNKTYPPFTGLNQADADETILHIAKLANQGMKTVDEMIVHTLVQRNS